MRLFGVTEEGLPRRADFTPREDVSFFCALKLDGGRPWRDCGAVRHASSSTTKMTSHRGGCSPSVRPREKRRHLIEFCECLTQLGAPGSNLVPRVRAYWQEVTNSFDEARVKRGYGRPRMRVPASGELSSPTNRVALQQSPLRNAESRWP